MSLTNLLPSKEKYRQEILTGLTTDQKKLSPKFLYDKRGSALFRKISKLEAYYLTHAENEILEMNAYEMSKWIGSKAILIEPGCGTCEKARYLLEQMKRPAGYVPMDIARDTLRQQSVKLKHEFDKIPIFPTVADYTENLSLPKEVKKISGKRVIFFAGSTIGNLSPSDALDLLDQMGDVVGPGGGLLIGVDLKKSARVLKRAYNDSQGITAKFNLNVLDRLNKEFAASFDRKKFHHEAIYNEQDGRVEMHLVSEVPQKVRVANEEIKFKKDEFILTESSYKYTVPEFTRMGERAGFRLLRTWQDHRRLFCVYYFERNASHV